MLGLMTPVVLITGATDGLGRGLVLALAARRATILVHGRNRERIGSTIEDVSSAGQAPIDFEDLMLEHRYSGVQAYCQSKLAQIMFTFDLARELEGSGVTANALHPATYMPTKIVPHPTSTLEEGIEATLRLI